MSEERENTVDAVRRLQDCINDLISIQALPAILSGQEPSQILATLLDALVRMLRLDFAFGRVSDGVDPLPSEAIRVARRRTAPVRAADVGQALESRLSGDSYAPFTAPNPLGDGNVSVAPIRLGLQDEVGLLLAASRRTDFPTATELMLLRVATNQAIIALQEARLLSQQKRAAAELERRVVKRTQQLTAANEDLKREIRERERAEEEIRKFAALVENSTDFIGIASLEGEALFVNRAGQRMVGLGGDEQARATRVLDYVMEEDRDYFQRQILPTVMRESCWDGERRFRHFKSGAAIPTLQHIFLIKEQGSDRPVAMATISRDITERMRAEDALRTAQEELARVTRVTTLGEFAASIAHEVNQPLAAVVTNGNAGLRWLAAASPNLDEARGALSRIIRDGNRASDVIARVRTLTRKTTTERVLLDINDAIEDVILIVQGDMRRDGVTLRKELAPDLPRVLGDRVQLQQVMLNLIVNGIEATGPVRDRPRDLVVTTQVDGADGLHVSVQDSGVGLESRNAQRIFEAFYTTKKDGMGMGLSISRSIIEAHKGLLWATANDGPGATLHFTLPVHHA